MNARHFGRATGLLALLAASIHAADIALLNVSYDPTRELYADINKSFAAKYKAETGDDIAIAQSHGGSGKQARSVIDGLKADVVTLSFVPDIDALYDKGRLLPKDWRERLPNHSSPYNSTIVLLVRKGNPKNIKDWDDVARPGVSVVTPNPKTGGGARVNYLAAWGYGVRKFKGDEARVNKFVGDIYRNVAVLDSGARGSTTTFVQRGIGDVLLAWENEAWLAQKELGAGKVEIVYPSSSILAELPVAVVDKVADRKGTRAVADAYLKYLYTDEAQELIAKNHYRPISPKVAAAHAGDFPKLELFTVDEFGGWAAAQKKHFDDGGVYDGFSK
jgi:sulfate/thiosulfate-binding protein